MGRSDEHTDKVGDLHSDGNGSFVSFITCLIPSLLILVPCHSTGACDIVRVVQLQSVNNLDWTCEFMQL